MKPILFNADMIHAILDGHKTVTRHVMKPQPKYATMTAAGLLTSENPIMIEDGLVVTKNANVTTWDKLPYRPGQILYVKETWAQYLDMDSAKRFWLYKADNPVKRIYDNNGILCDDQRIEWKSSVYMPKEAARLFLRVTDLKVQRVQDITVDEILREGIEDIEPPAVCQENIPFPIGFDQWSMEQQDDWYNSTARAKYIGWSDYADKLIGKFARVWNDCYSKPHPIKGKDREIDHYESYPWEDIHETRTYRGKPWCVIGNPWVRAIEFERINKETIATAVS